jgi:alpha-mannosidase
VQIGARQILRVLASDLPSLGYKVFEIRPGPGRRPADGPKVHGGGLENEWYRVTVTPRGAIASLIDKMRDSRQFVEPIDGRELNDLGPGNGTLSPCNVGPVSVTLKATANKPLAHTTHVTLYRQIARIDIRNEITQNFDCDYETPYTWGYSFALQQPDVWHEECGTVVRARRASDGGHYSNTCARVDWLTMNHFADVTGSDGVGVTLSNTDCYFMKLGRSTPSRLDTSTPQVNVLVGGRVGGSKNSGFRNQGGDRRFLQRFSLQTHGRYSEAAAMRFSLEHQNPPVTAAVTGGNIYPDASFSLLAISDPNVLLWAVKPAEEGIDEGVVIRLWNHGSAPTAVQVRFRGGLRCAIRTTHIETDLEDATLTNDVLADELRDNWMQTYRLFPRH